MSLLNRKHKKFCIRAIMLVILTVFLVAGLTLGTLTVLAYPAYSFYVSNWEMEYGGSADSFSKWTADPGVAGFEVDTKYAHSGTKSLRLSHDFNTGTSAWIQSLAGLEVGQTYTVTGWIKTKKVEYNSSSLNACIGIDMKDSQGSIIDTVNSDQLYGSKDWTEVSFNFTVAQGTDTILLVARLWDTKGTVWFDDISVVKEYAQNRDVESGSGLPDYYYNWTSDPNTSSFVWDSQVSHSEDHSLKISQSGACYSAWYQSISGLEEGENYKASGWVKTENVGEDVLDSCIGVDMKDYSGYILDSANSAPINGTEDWTYVSVDFTVPQDTTQVLLLNRLWNVTGTAWFDDMSVVREYIQNGSAETCTQMPDNYTTWSSSQNTVFTWDAGEYLKSEDLGDRSVKISQSTDETSCWYQELSGLEAGKTYKLMGFIKTENVGTSGQGASIGIDMKDQNYDIISTISTDALTGTNDWSYMTETFTVPTGTNQVLLLLKIWGDAGAVWFDAVAVIEVGDQITEPSLSDPWWDNWPRFTYHAVDIMAISYIDANVLNVAPGMHDEGRGPYFRENMYIMNNPIYLFADAEGLKRCAWLEGMGDTRAIINAVNNLGNDNYEIDPETGAPKLISHAWNWDELGYGVNADANEVVWAGLHSYVNNEDWLGDFTLSESQNLSAPTYPDSSSAVGYLQGGTNDPTKAKLYDAMAGKDINGDLYISITGVWGENHEGKVDVSVLGQTVQNVGDMYFPKDQASPWWVEYNIDAARWFIDNGADGFWVDNYSGWDAMGNTPIYGAFGEWSVALFRDFLDEHPEVGIQDPSNFDIRAYLKDQFEDWYPLLDSSDLTDTDTKNAWRDSDWLEDPVWMAYISFKSEIQSTRAKELYDGIKEQAYLAGKDPDDICVGANDVPRLSYAAIDGTQMDMCNVEYSPSFTPVTGNSADGLPPYGHASTFYSLATNFAIGRHANIWYYLEGIYEEHRLKPSLGEILGYEALAHNTILNTGENLPLNPGTDTSSRLVNRTIKRMAEIFDKREKAGKLGLLYSTNSEYAQLTPGGYANEGQNPHVLEFYGWGNALEELNVPYKTIPDFKLTLNDLSDIEVLIVPHVKSISSDMVGVLTSFVNNGGRVLVSGTDSGSIDIRQNLYGDNGSALLYDMTQQSLGQFVQGTPGADFYSEHLTPGTERDDALDEISDIMAGLYQNSYLTQELVLTNMNDHVWSALNYDSTNDRFFVDLINANIDLSTDTITSEDGGTITVKIPSALQNLTLRVRFYDADDNGSYQQPNVQVIDTETISVTIPEFRVYGSVVIEEAP